MAATKLPLECNIIVEIGGRDVISYLGIMREFARRRKLRRWFVRVPVLSLSLSSRWLTLITPVYASVGRCLIESVRHASVVENGNAAELFSIQPMGITEAIERALRHEDRPSAESRWSDAAGRTGERSVAPDSGRDLLVNAQTVRMPLSAGEAFAPIRRIGGPTGWYFGNALWRIRGLIDLMTGGVGMRRGRPDPGDSAPGKHAGFLACGPLRAGPAAAALCGDATPGTRMARVSSGIGRILHNPQADRAVRTARPGWTSILVSFIACPRYHVSPDVEAHFYRCAPPGTPGRIYADPAASDNNRWIK